MNRLTSTLNRPCRRNQRSHKRSQEKKSAVPDNIIAEILKNDLEETTKILKLLARSGTQKSSQMIGKRRPHRVWKLPWYSATGSARKNFKYDYSFRIKSKVDKKLRPNQARFKPGRSCADQTAALRIIIEQCCEWNASPYIDFGNYEKAFNLLIATHFGS